MLDALEKSVNSFTDPGDSVLIMEPVYHPFRYIVEAVNRSVSNVQLLNREGVYTMDFEAIEKTIVEDKVKFIIFCSPQNPVGRVWRKEKLIQLTKLAQK